MVPALEWNNAYSVGNSVLDAEHRELISRINEICARRAADNSEVRHSLFQTLLKFVKHHFAHEDGILRKVAQADAGTSEDAKTISRATIREHIASHALSLANLNIIGERITNATPDERQRQYDALKIWFIDHAVKHDAHLKAMFQAM